MTHTTAVADKSNKIKNKTDPATHKIPSFCKIGTRRQHGAHVCIMWVDLVHKMALGLLC